MYAPTFTSSDWFPAVFVIGNVTSEMQHASEIHANEGKAEVKSLRHKLIN